MSKHITVTEPKNTDFITLHVYNDTNGERVYHHGKAFKEGTYVNSPHILVSILLVQTNEVIALSSFHPLLYQIRFNAPSGTSTYTIVFSQHEKLKTLYFSLKAFSFSRFELTEVPQTYPIEQKVLRSTNSLLTYTSLFFFFFFSCSPLHNSRYLVDGRISQVEATHPMQVS